MSCDRETSRCHEGRSGASDGEHREDHRHVRSPGSLHGNVRFWSQRCQASATRIRCCLATGRLASTAQRRTSAEEHRTRGSGTWELDWRAPSRRVHAGQTLRFGLRNLLAQRYITCFRRLRDSTLYIDQESQGLCSGDGRGGGRRARRVSGIAAGQKHLSAGVLSRRYSRAGRMATVCLERFLLPTPTLRQHQGTSSSGL